MTGGEGGILANPSMVFNNQWVRYGQVWVCVTPLCNTYYTKHLIIINTNLI